MSLLDLRLFAVELVERRNKAAILLTPDLREQRSYAAQIAAAVNGFHLDVLDCFQVDESLTARLTSFSMGDLFALLGDHKDRRFLVVSGIEFLLAAWLSQGQPKEVKRTLCHQIELWENQPPFLLVTHHDPVFADYEPQRHSVGPVVIEMSHTLALE
jgi:hypothetical protein